MGKLYDMYYKQVIDALSKEGERLATEAYKTKETKNRTFNQADAFGYAVYHNKDLKAKGYAKPTRQATKMHKGYGSIPTGYGRDWLDSYLLNFKPESDGFVLVVLNATYYTKFLEEGTNAAKRKFAVISQIYDKMDELAIKGRGTLTLI